MEEKSPPEYPTYVSFPAMARMQRYLGRTMDHHCTRSWGLVIYVAFLRFILDLCLGHDVDFMTRFPLKYAEVTKVVLE